MAGGNDGRINLVSLMAGNIIDDSEELTATKGFTKNEIVAQALFFQLAGQDTTATVLSFLLYSLSKTPTGPEYDRSVEWLWRSAHGGDSCSFPVDTLTVLPCPDWLIRCGVGEQARGGTQKFAALR